MVYETCYKGAFSEAELHTLRCRLNEGRLNKARRGALMGVPPIGYIRLASGEWAIDPDEQVQTTVRLIFDQFDRETTLHGLLRYLVRAIEDGHADDVQLVPVSIVISVVVIP